MRILFLSTSMGLGGADQQLLSAAQVLRDRGHEIRIVSLTPLGPMGLQARGLALTTDDPRVRSDALAEGEVLLAAGSASHNHLQFRRDAIDASLDTEDWSGAELHSDALETYTREEPLRWSGFFVARGRALAAYGRGRRNAALMVKLADLREEGKRLVAEGRTTEAEAQRVVEGST